MIRLTLPAWTGTTFGASLPAMMGRSGWPSSAAAWTNSILRRGRLSISGANSSTPSSLSSDRATSVLEDRSGSVWVGTWDAGLDRFDPATGTFSHYVHDPADPTSLSDNTVYSLVEDRNGDLWIGTFNGGLNRFESATGAFTRYQGDSKQRSEPSFQFSDIDLSRPVR